MGSSRTTRLARRSRTRRRALPGGASRAPLQAKKRLPPVLGGGARKRLPAVKRPSWKLVGLAGIAGVAATGVVVARNRRAHRDLPPDELRERLHRRLAEVGSDAGSSGDAAPPAPPR